MIQPFKINKLLGPYDMAQSRNNYVIENNTDFFNYH